MANNVDIALLRDWTSVWETQGQAQYVTFRQTLTLRLTYSTWKVYFLTEQESDIMFEF